MNSLHETIKQRSTINELQEPRKRRRAFISDPRPETPDAVFDADSKTFL
jgi:hypothetical protein